ncbi:MAG TPA: hypothetical protein PKC45_14825 [Gemmatales bacterium]|nr:hypothetical protein [Gemmatales bacterium]
MEQQFLTVLDNQMRPYAPSVVGDIELSYDAANSLATTISREISTANNKDDLLESLRASSALTVKRRLFFFEDLQIWNAKIEPTLHCPTEHEFPPERVETAFHEMLSVIQLYVSFVFVGDGLFECLAKEGPPDSCVQKCASYIRKNPIRALRNAVAHGNWHLTHTGTVKYWARRGPKANEALTQFEATADRMNFFVNLTRCVAWSSLRTVVNELGEGQGGLENV